MKNLVSGLTALLLLSASMPASAGPHDYRGERHFKHDRHAYKHNRHHHPRHYHHHAPAWGALGLGLAVGGVLLAIDAPRPPPVVVMPVPPPVVRAPERLWYYCDSARAYYPYVQQCYEGWRAVPALP